jgi:hypothetical protein
MTFNPGPKVSKKVCHTPIGQKLREEKDFLETSCFQPRDLSLRPADLTPQKLLVQIWNVPKFFIMILSFHQK